MQRWPELTQEEPELTQKMEVEEPELTQKMELEEPELTQMMEEKAPSIMPADVVRGITLIRDFLKVIHEAEACTKFPELMGRDIDATDKAVKDPNYSQHALSLAYTRIRSVAKH